MGLINNFRAKAMKIKNISKYKEKKLLKSLCDKISFKPGVQNDKISVKLNGSKNHHKKLHG